MNINETIIAAVFISIMLIGYSSIVYAYEKTHMIMASYFGIKTTMELKWFGLLGGEVKIDPNQYLNLTSQQLLIGKLFDSVNELVSYQFFVMFWILCGMFLLMLIYFVKVERQLNG